MKFRFTTEIYYILTKLLIAGGVLLIVARVWLSSNSVDSDSAVTGLMGLHILQGKDFPLFFYGQAYMGSLEAILAALSFKLFGFSASALSLVPTAFWGAFLTAQYFLVKRVFGRLTAHLSTLLLAFPTSFMAFMIPKAWGNYTANLFLGTIILLLSYKIAGLEKRADHRTKTMTTLGLLSGLALWTNFGSLIFILTGWLFLLIKDYKIVRDRSWRGYMGGVAVGLFPLLLFNAFPIAGSRLLGFPLKDSSCWQTLKFLTTSGQPWRVKLIWGFGNLVKVVTICLPIILGAQFTTGYYLIPTLSKLVLVFWVIATGWYVWVKDQLFRKIASFRKVPFDEVFKLYPLVLGGLLIFNYCFGNFFFSPDQPRYLLPLYLVFPVLAAQFLLWVKSKNLTLFASLLVLVVVHNVYAEYGLHLEFSPFAKRPNRDTQLIEVLQDLKLNRVYAGYWTAFPIIFGTQEEIIASPKYGPGNLERYPNYTRMVDASADPAYIFPKQVTEKEGECELIFKEVTGDGGVSYDFAETKEFRIYYHLSQDIRDRLPVAP